MKILLIIIISISLYANTKQKMFALYQKHQYKNVCNIGYNSLIQNKKDEEFVSLYAFSCLKSDYIDRLSLPINMLKYSPEARSNAAYFSIILMQKKLLYHSLVDGYNLHKIKLPTTDHILSKIFNFYSQIGPHEQKPFYFFKDANDSHLTYKLYLIRGTKIHKIIIEEFYNSVITNKHIYW